MSTRKTTEHLWFYPYLQYRQLRYVGYNVHYISLQNTCDSTLTFGIVSYTMWVRCPLVKLQNTHGFILTFSIASYSMWVRCGYDVHDIKLQNTCDSSLTFSIARSGVREVIEGGGEQGKMEETGCEIICGVPTTLAVKG